MRKDMAAADLGGAQGAIGYKFKDVGLLTVALTHSSYAHERGLPWEACNERLEFLGDAVIGMVVGERLFMMDGATKEGEMTRSRASYVRKESLASYALLAGLDGYLLLGSGEEACKGRQKESLLADAFEAVIGAVYLDSGKDLALIDSIFFGFAGTARGGEAVGDGKDYKSLLQELMQEGGQDHGISYVPLKEEGPPHRRRYTVGAFVRGVKRGEGTAGTKKAAEQAAAREAYARMGPGDA
ncbi:MAG: ribonuclease III [Oscillospiraceae bacterium]|nr:ribonuclease III [Oscillospiraceae bacterium]